MGTRWAVLPLRAVLGVVFLAHGVQKLAESGLAGTAGFLGALGIPLPTVAAAVVIAVEALGGAALLLGAATRVAAALLAIDMLGALFTVHLGQGFFLPRGVEFVLTLLAGSLTLAGLGAGPLSVDAALRRRAG